MPGGGGWAWSGPVPPVVDARLDAASEADLPMRWAVCHWALCACKDKGRLISPLDNTPRELGTFLVFLILCSFLFCMFLEK